jgi:[NiFe] hydrogenase diaphorase moiety large subunit
MSAELTGVVRHACERYHHDPERLVEICADVQRHCGQVDREAIDLLAAELGVRRPDVESVVTFYAFLSVEPVGRTVVRLSNDVPDWMAGAEAVGDAFSEALGLPFGGVTADGRVGLQWTACIGMSDQAPAALVGDTVVTRLTPERARHVARAVLAASNGSDGASPDLGPLIAVGDGNNAHPLVRAGVRNNLRKEGPVIFGDWQPGAGLAKAMAMTPAEVIRTVKTARLRGRGGAGFPTGMKWEFTRAAPGAPKYVLCNADEGEPGTFKDRVILTERPEMVFEGMAIAGYAIGASRGIVYLRAEYEYLRPFLEEVLATMRGSGRLPASGAGSDGFAFDIEIRMGAGAYVCGEETALISSIEGLRGDPKTRPPFPAQEGYRRHPSVVNNVETFCCATMILEEGAGWFSQCGTPVSPGTKLLSVSGDCTSPGVYEYPFGVTLGEVLEDAGAGDAIAAQVGGAAGLLVGRDAFGRSICFDDLATGGSLMAFGPGRDVVDIAAHFARFFVHESCGYCTPCRVGTVLMLERVERILESRGERSDLDYLRALGATMRAASRCGLGQTAPNPVLSAMDAFPEAFERRLAPIVAGRQPGFDVQAALAEASGLAGRPSTHFAKSGGER